MHKGIITLALKIIMVAVIGYWVIGLFSGNESFKGTTLPAHTRILSFGDSLTQGVGASRGKDYPNQLAQIVGRSVVNAGISGETTEGGKRRFAEVLEQNQPDVVVLLEGGNDFLRNVPRAQTKANLGAMIEMAQARDIKVLLVAVPAKSLMLSDALIYQELADQYHVPLLSDTISDLLGDRSVKSDTIHLNDTGYKKLAIAIAKKLNELY